MNKVSLPKKDGAAAAPVPKFSNVLFIRVRDLAKDASGKITGFPTKDANGVKMTGAFTMTATEKAVGVYCTPSTISRNDTSEGDDDAVAFIQNFEGHHPGDSLPFNEWVQNNINEDFIIITSECSESDGTRVHGTPCNPMKLTFEGQDNNEAKKGMLKFSQKMRSKFKSAHYTGVLPAIAADADYDGSGASGI